MAHGTWQEEQQRDTLLRRAFRLEWLTVGWNAIEGLVAIVAALVAGSVVLLSFGIDSVIETSSGIVILWRIAADKRARDQSAVARAEYLARRGVAVSLCLLAIYVSYEAASSLIGGERPDTSAVGVVLLVLSIAVMKWLAMAKRSTALALHSHAMEADAAQTNLCFQLSAVAMAGLGANALFGWWWADPAGALVIAVLISLEARRAWRDPGACCH